MARDAELRARITAKDDASKVIDKVADAARDLEDHPVEVEVDADVRNVLSALDQVSAEAKQSAEAAEALGRALGPELAAKADTGAIVSDLKNMGLSIDQIKGNADELGAKMRELSDADVGGGLGKSLGTARGELDNLGKSADSSKSVLANMVGNSVQDLGALGGVAGSAGVAIGQMGEYMADAASGGDSLSQILGGFGKVAGPLAGIAIATQLLTSAMEKGKKAAEAHAKGIERMAAAAEEGTGVVGALEDQLEETGKIALTFGGGFDFAGIQIKDLREQLDTLHLTVEEFADMVGDKPVRSLEDYYQANKDVIGTNDDWVKTFAARDELTNQVADSEAERALNTRLGVKADKEAVTASAAVAAAYEKAAAELDDWVASTTRALEGTQAYKDALAGIDFRTADAMGGLAAMGTMTDLLFAQSNMAQADAEAWDALKTSVEDNGKVWDVNTEKGRANMDALEGVARALEDDLAVAYRDADGDAKKFQDTAGAIANTTLKRLQKELKLSDGETQILGKQLGLLPEDIETRYKLSGDEEAKIKIGLLQTAIDNLPEDVNTKVTQQIITGDYQGALATIQNYYNGHPIVGRVNVIQGSGWEIFNPKSIQADVDVTKGSGWGIFSNPFGRSVAAPAGLAATQTATVVPVTFQLPSAGQIARQVGKVTIPFTVASHLRADQRLAGTRNL